MPSAHCVSTIDGVILDADQGFVDLVGRPEHELIGVSYKSITHPQDLGKSAAMLAALVANAAPVRLQKRYVRPDGSSVSANVLVTRFTDPDRLVSTLYWNDTGRRLPPAKLWGGRIRVRHVQNVRRAEFGADLFADGLDGLLMEIYLAEAEGRTVSVDELLERVAAPASVAIRWMRLLQDRAIVHPVAEDGADVRFSHAGLLMMENTLTAVAQPMLAGVSEA